MKRFLTAELPVWAFLLGSLVAAAAVDIIKWLL